MLYMMLFLRNLAGGTDKTAAERQGKCAADKAAAGKKSKISDRDDQIVELMAAVF